MLLQPLKLKAVLPYMRDEQVPVSGNSILANGQFVDATLARAYTFYTFPGVDRKRGRKPVR